MWQTRRRRSREARRQGQGQWTAFTRCAESQYARTGEAGGCPARARVWLARRPRRRYQALRWCRSPAFPRRGPGTSRHPRPIQTHVLDADLGTRASERATRHNRCPAPSERTSLCSRHAARNLIAVSAPGPLTASNFDRGPRRSWLMSNSATTQRARDRVERSSAPGSCRPKRYEAH